jgi:cytochrome c-type biogenesis protein
LTLSLNGGSVSNGVTLLSFYSAGLAIPFLLAALSVGWVSVTLRKYGKLMHYVEQAMGVILVIIGYMLFSGIFERLAQAGQFFWIDFGI